MSDTNTITDSDVVCAVHFSPTASQSCYTFVTDNVDYVKNFNKDYAIAGGKISSLQLGSVFSYKNIFQICKDFSGLKSIYFLCRNCPSLERFHAGSTISVRDFYERNKISGCFDNCINAQCAFGYNDKITDIDLSFPVCTDFQGNYQYSTNLTTVKLNCPNAINMVGEFVGCTKLQTVTFKSDLKYLVCGKQMFEGCEMLSSFNYSIPSLLSGINMFTGCQLDIYSIKTILENLPDVTDENGVKLNDYSLTDEDVNKLHLIDTDNIWKNGLYANDDKSVTENTIMKNLRRDKANSSFSFYIKGISITYNPSTQQFEENTNWVKKNIPFGEFGVINFGVDKETELMLDLISTDAVYHDVIKSAINKGWRITYNDKPIK